MHIWKKASLGILTSAMLVSGLGVGVAPANAAGSVPAVVSDPGPSGDFNWKGFNWQKRTWGGGPMYNGQWSPNNVNNPDAKGYVKLNITNPTGSAPVAAEIQSTRRGFGYGIYTTVVEKDVNTLQKESVWGCLFTYDPDSPPGFAEIDLCEASAWGGGAQWGESWPVTQGHGYWFDAALGPGAGNTVVTFPVTSSPILTHRMVWEPGRITYETFEGEGFTGKLIKRTVLEGSKVPVPAKEYLLFNLWVVGGGGGNPGAVKPESVTIRDFSFTPTGIASTAPSTSPTITSSPSAPATSTTAPTTTTSPSPTAAATTTPSSPFPSATATTTQKANGNSKKTKSGSTTVTSDEPSSVTETTSKVKKNHNGSYKLFPALI